MLYSINSDGPDLRAIVSGAIGDYGQAVTVLPDGKVDPSHTHDVELKLAHGSFKLSIAVLDNRFVAITRHEPIYPRTCSDHMTATAVTPIVPGSGTGAYRGISGRFDVTITADEVEKKPVSRPRRSSGRPSCCPAPAPCRAASGHDRAVAPATAASAAGPCVPWAHAHRARPAARSLHAAGWRAGGPAVRGQP